MAYDTVAHSNTFYIDDLRDNRRKQQQRKTKGKALQTISTHDLVAFKCKNENQVKALASLKANECSVLYGSAGTGKTFLALYHALHEVLSGGYAKVAIVRSALPTREIGHLPGTVEEKLEAYEAPYKALITEITGHPTAYDKLKIQGRIEFHSTSFLRGLTFTDTIILFDEFQGAIFHEIDTVITRMGEGCKLILCGDSRQCDLNKRKETSGFEQVLSILSKLDSVGMVQFGPEDVVRSGFVGMYLRERERQGL